MAGIGLRLHKLVAKGNYIHAATAYLSSAIIAAGPWLAGVLALALLGSAVVAFLDQSDRELLFATIIYAFAFSLVVAGGPQLVITRYLADRLYLDDTGAIAPTCAGVLLSALPVLVLAAPFLALAPFEWRYRLMVASLALTLVLIWLVMVFLSAARDHTRVVLILVAGYALSLAAAVWFGHRYGLLGSLGGFTLGQVVCLTLMVGHIYREFPSSGISLAFLRHFGKYRSLLLIGFLYMAGIWIDNVIYWFSPHGSAIAGFYRVFPAYDSAKLLGYVATVPAAALFLVHLETHFYRHYRAFCHHIVSKGTLAQINQGKQGMMEAARAGIVAIVKLQAVVTMAVLLLANDVAAFLELPSSAVALLRVGSLAASAQFVMLVAILLLLYLDKRVEALRVVTVFALGNASLTLATVWLGYRFYGAGYLVAAATACLLGLYYLNDRLKRLEYLTFMLQPLE